MATCNWITRISGSGRQRRCHGARRVQQRHEAGGMHRGAMCRGYLWLCSGVVRVICPALASDTAEACLIRALARPNAGKVLQLSQDIIAMGRCAQEAVSRESRRVRTGHAASTLLRLRAAASAAVRGVCELWKPFPYR